MSCPGNKIAVIENLGATEVHFSQINVELCLSVISLLLCKVSLYYSDEIFVYLSLLLFVFCY